MLWDVLLIYIQDTCFWQATPFLYGNNWLIERTLMYKYLGNIFSETRTIRGDMFKHTYDYLCVKSQRALLSSNKQLNHLGTLPPKLSLHLFKTNIEPILTYGSEIWGTNKSGCDEIDTFCLRFMKSVLGVKSSTSTIAVYGELGFFPPSLVAHTRVQYYCTCHPISWPVEPSRVKCRCIIKGLTRG